MSECAGNESFVPDMWSTNTLINKHLLLAVMLHVNVRLLQADTCEPRGTIRPPFSRRTLAERSPSVETLNPLKQHLECEVVVVQ